MDDDRPKPTPPRSGEDALFECFGDRYVVKAPIQVRGSLIASDLASRIQSTAEDRSGLVIPHCPFRISSGPEVWRRSEVTFVSFQRWPADLRLLRDEPWGVVPNLMVELVGPTTIAEEIPTKMREYFEAGVQKASVIDLHESLVYR